MYSKNSNIKPISDLRNYSKVLRDVTYERVIAMIKLMGTLEVGRKSGEEQGWISSEQLKSELGI